MEEDWKKIKDGWEVSSEGNIKKPDGNIIKFRSRGYRRCDLGLVHRIVAYYFCNPPGPVNEAWVCEGYEVHHKNKHPWDNRAENLIYLTHQEHREIHKGRRETKEYQGIDKRLILDFLNSLRN